MWAGTALQDQGSRTFLWGRGRESGDSGYAAAGFDPPDRGPDAEKQLVARQGSEQTRERPPRRAEGAAGRWPNAPDRPSGRTYSIRQYTTRPRITWRPNTDLRAALSYRYTDKLNREELGGEAATVQNLGLEARWNTAGKGSIQLNLDLVDIRYDGDPNTSLGNEMLGGLKVGTNWTWSLSIQRRLNQNLQVDITYNGRKSENTPTVHVGGAQIRAFF